MDALRWESRPKLRSPVLVCAFKGWNDAAESASLAIGFLAQRWNAEQFATLDPEEFFDFQVTRPTVRLEEGRTRTIEWPEMTFSVARPPGLDRDIVLMVGLEPNLRWRTFCEMMLDFMRELGIESIVTLGALLADVPHTRSARVVGLASDAALVERLGFSETRYEGPTGIVGVLHDSCAKAGLSAVSLWTPVPHYVAAVASPKAALALIGRLGELLSLDIDTGDLEESAGDYERRLDEAVEREPEVQQLVERLEQQIDEQDVTFGDLPSGDSIAREFQRYLRGQGDAP